MPIKIKFDNGHTVQFDSQPSDADIEEAYAHTKTLPKKEKPVSQMKAPTWVGAPEAALSMLAGMPSQIAGGLYGLGTLLSGQGIDKAGDAVRQVQESNFGLGSFQGITDPGKRATQAVSEAFQKPGEWAGDAGAALGRQFGNEDLGRLSLQLPVDAAMNFLPLHLGVTMPLRAAKRKIDSLGQPSVKEKLQSVRETTPEQPVPTIPEAPDLRLEHPIAAENRVAAQNKAVRGADDWNSMDHAARAVDEEIAAMEQLQRQQAEEALAAEQARTHAFLRDAQQTVIDDTPHGDRPAQFGMTDEFGRVDEGVPGIERDATGQMRVVQGSGIPIRADLSIEAQQLQNPLQRNLWGDELGPALGAERSLTEAIDSMPPGPAREQGMSQLRGQRGAIDFGNNASGESPASLEALGRLMEERRLDRVRAVIKQDGTVTPLIGVDAVDYRPRPGEVVVQKNVGNTPWTILDSNGVKNPTAQLNRGMSRGQRGALDWGDSRTNDFLNKLNPFSNKARFAKIQQHTGHLAEQMGESFPSMAKFLKRRDIQELINDMVEAEKHADPIQFWQEKLAGVSALEDPTLGGQMQRIGKNTLMGQARGPRDMLELHLTPEQAAEATDFAAAIDQLRSEFMKGKQKAQEPVHPDPSRYTWPKGKDPFFHDERMQNKGYARDYAKFEKQVQEWNAEVARLHAAFAENYGFNPDGFYPSEFMEPVDAVWDLIHGVASKMHSDEQAAITKHGLKGFTGGISTGNSPTGRRMDRGAIDLQGILDAFKPGKQDTVVDKLLATKHYQQKTNVDDVIREALAQGPTSVGSTLFGAGGTMEAAKTNNKAIQGAVRIRQREGNIAEDHTRSFVFPLEKALRKFSQKDMQDFAYVLRDENKNGKLSMEQLATIFDEKSLLAYNKFREMQDNALRVTNEARALQGKKPITAEEAYLSSVWSGDFRMLFQDEKGRNVWALASQTKRGLNKQLEALKKDHPEIAALKKTEFTVTSNKKAGFSGNSYSEILDLIGRDTPEGQALAQWYETKVEAEGRSFLGQEKHFQPKSGTRGFIGDRPGKDVGKEAIELLQAQITQAKSAFQWAGIQRAGVDIKKILSNEDLITQQPETVRWIREYWHDQLGINDSTLSKGVDDMLRTMGASPAAVNQVVSFGKNLWTTSKLAVNIPFALGSNGLQLSAVAPHLADLTVKHKANPIAGIIVGPILGTYMATGHILGAPKQMYSTLRQVLPNIRSEFWLTAMKYAEDNSIVARSIYDEAPIEKNFGGFNKVNKALGKTITLPETEVRGVAFLTYAASLKAGFNKLSDAEIFRLAEERVSMSMGDYREGERAMIFNKAGIVGNASSTLTTFPMNYLNGWNWAGREAGRGNVLPIMAMFATQAYVAGLMGIPGFSDVDKLIELGKDFLASHYPTAWAKVRDFNLKRMALQLPYGETALYGGVSTQTGVGLTSRAAAPSFAEMSTTPFAPAEELASMAGSVGSAALSGFSDPTKNAQAAYTVSPTGLQGLMETSVLRDQTVAGPYGEGRTLYKNPRDLAGREGGYARTPEEEKLRALGFRSQQETVTRDLEWLSSKDLQRANKVKKELPDRVWNALRNQDMDNARDYLQLYTQLSGKGMTKQQLENQLVQEFTASKDRAWLKKNMPLEQVLVLKRLRQQLEELGYAN